MFSKITVQGITAFRFCLCGDKHKLFCSASAFRTGRFGGKDCFDGFVWCSHMVGCCVSCTGIDVRLQFREFLQQVKLSAAVGTVTGMYTDFFGFTDVVVFVDQYKNRRCAFTGFIPDMVCRTAGLGACHNGIFPSFGIYHGFCTVIDTLFGHSLHLPFCNFIYRVYYIIYHVPVSMSDLPDYVGFVLTLHKSYAIVMSKLEDVRKWLKKSGLTA